MEINLAAAVAKATLPSPLDLGNEVLYDMCRRHPLHSDVPSAIAKVWLIGRSYAAAVERRRDKTSENDDFYIQSVGPAMVESDIDSWIAATRMHPFINRSCIDLMLDVHCRTTDLFKKISGQRKRSLASKYLHFHVPLMFYIFDNRAVEALRGVSSMVGYQRKAMESGDNDYRKFAENCLGLQEHIEANHGERLTPRQLDNLLLGISSAKAR